MHQVTLPVLEEDGTVVLSWCDYGYHKKYSKDKVKPSIV
jgi:hypothetical protein